MQMTLPLTVGSVENIFTQFWQGVLLRCHIVT